MRPDHPSAEWSAGLDTLHARIADRFRCSEARSRVKRYLAGLLDRIERKNGWQLAEHLGESGPQGIQRLLNGGDWDADAVRDDLRTYVVEHLGAANGVLIVDETGFLKKGTKSVSVHRQYSGAAGRIENCQIGVFVAYASDAGTAFIDRALYLPEAWARDADRRREVGVPTAITIATKPALAQETLARAFAAGVPAAWVTADEIYGDSADLHQWLELNQHPYVMAVSSAHLFGQGGDQIRADHLIAALPPTAWATCSAGDGRQGARLADWAWLRLPYVELPGTAQWLVVQRGLGDPTELAYVRAAGPAGTAVAELIRVARMQWAIEVGFEDAKGVIGLDQYEVRNWTPWHRHITLALLAHAYLAMTRHYARSDAGKKWGSSTICSRRRSRKCADYCWRWRMTRSDRATD